MSEVQLSQHPASIESHEHLQLREAFAEAAVNGTRTWVLDKNGNRMVMIIPADDGSWLESQGLEA